MANKSSLLRVLELMRGEELREVAEHRGLATSGSRAALARRIARDSGRDLDEIVGPRGAWTRDMWNDFIVEHFHGARRRSWDEVREEIELGLGGDAEEVLQALQADRVTIGDLRGDDALAEKYAQLLGTTARRLLNHVADEHGNRTLASLAGDLVRHFQPHRRADTEVAFAGDDDDSDDDEADLQSERVGSSASAAGSDAGHVTRPLARPSVGHRLNGRWRIVRELGGGGMGTAYEVVNARALTRVAKVAHSDGSDTEALIREATLGLDLAHENVCRYYDIDDDERYGVFVIMQHCGESLGQRYRARAADPLEAMLLLAQAAAGIDYLHSKGIFHGDVSPANILVDKSGQVRIIDFGIAGQMRAVTRTSGLTHVGELRGRNAAFASAEVNAGQPPRRGSDQASLAKVLCALLLGVEQYHREPRMTFHRLGPAQAALDRALHPDIERRHASCVSFVHELINGGGS